MKTAIHDKKLLNIDQLNREDYQRIYDEGKRGNLCCPVCRESVRLYIGIREDPHFYHLLKKNPPCQDQVIPTPEEASPKIEYVERNGFKIPKTRSIVAEQQTSEFNKPRRVKIPSPFHKKPSYFSTTHTSEYIDLLMKNGVKLDSNQLAAVSHIDGALLVVAGAGSGKTRVLTTRTAYMLNERNIDPRSIMLVTFTAKAAAEMKARLSQYPSMNNSHITQLLAGTFHSIFYRILSFHDREKWSSEKLLKKDWQKEQILKDSGKQLDLDEKEFAYDLAIQQIGFWKNSLVSPHEVKPESAWEEKVAILYKNYEDVKSERQLFDFDDMLLGCYYLLKENPNILEIYQKRFEYFLIDEFQDINKVQYELVKLLSSKSKNICAVGDDDQSIYSFRGSDPNYLLHFERDFPNSKLVILNENYRSSYEIVETANQVIKKNKDRRPKEMNAQFSTELAPTMFFPIDEEEEATMIVQDIREKIEEGFEPKDFAILFRTNTGSRAAFERLANSSLPFRIDLDMEPFYERFIVKGMLSFLQLSLDEDNQQAIKQILPSMFIKQNVMQDLKATSILEDCSLLECLSKVKTGFAFQERKLKKVVPVIRSLSGLSPLTAIEIVEKELGFGDFIKKRGNEGNKLDKGSDDIKDLKVAAKAFNSLSDFLDHVDHMTAMNKEVKNLSKHQENVITLSTIHRAKGLEYKVVYIIGGVDGSIPHDYALDSWRNGDEAPLEEERRLLYVAITRAMQHLYISIPEKRRGRKVYPSRLLAPIRKL